MHFRARASRLRFRLRDLTARREKSALRRSKNWRRYSSRKRVQRRRPTSVQRFDAASERFGAYCRGVAKTSTLDARLPFVAIDNRTGLLVETSLQTAPTTFYVLFERRAKHRLIILERRVRRRLNLLGATRPTSFNHLGAARPTPLNLLGATRQTPFNLLKAAAPNATTRAERLNRR